MYNPNKIFPCHALKIDVHESIGWQYASRLCNTLIDETRQRVPPLLQKNSCVYLFLYLQVTKNEAAAEATVAASSSLAASQAALANFAPVVHNANVTLNVSLIKIVINVSLLTSLWYTYVPA